MATTEPTHRDDAATDGPPTRSDPSDRLLSIGQFSGYCRLSVRMLRYYDEHDVLVPQWVDPDSGYRHYAPSQIADAAMVRALRDIGFSVAAIAALLPQALAATAGPPPGSPTAPDPGPVQRSAAAAFRRALLIQRDHLVAEASALDRRLADLDRLITLTEEDTMSTSRSTSIEITEKTLPAHTIVGLRGTIPEYAAEGQAWAQLMPMLGRAGLMPPTDVCGATFYDEEYRERDVDVEVWSPVRGPAAAITVDAPLTCRDVPEQRLLVGTLRGGYDGMPDAYQALGERLTAEGLTATGLMFNRYLVGPTQANDPADYVTEICIPV